MSTFNANHREREPSGRLLHPVLFYSLTFAIAWTAWTPLLLHKFDVLQLPVPFVITLFIGQTGGAFAPLLSLFAIQRICNDPTLVRRVFNQLRFKQMSIFWCLVPALTPIALTMIATAWHGFLTSDGITILRPEPVDEVGWALLAVIPIQFVLGLIGSPLGEEPGWRGYVLDGFARNGRALFGSSVVASLWWIWHLPLFVVLGVELTASSCVVMVSHSLLIDSLFLLSGHNLLVAMVYHQGINTSFLFLVSKADTAAGAALLFVIAIFVRVAVHHFHEPLKWED